MHLVPKWIIFVTLVVLALFSTSGAYGQTVQGQIGGTVTDPGGSVVPGADVAVKNLDTGLERKSVTSQAGVYFLPSIPPGRYSLTISATGFQNFVVPEILLTVNQARTIDAQLSIGVVQETVEVSASAVALDATTSSLGAVVQHRSIVEMPLNGRNFTQLVLLTPGAAPVQQGQASTFVVTGGISPSVNGMRSRNNNFTLDGGENNQRFSNTYAQSPPPDAIAEFKVDSHQSGADVSVGAGSNVNLVTRSGSNELHGSVWDFLRNNAVNARGFFPNYYNQAVLPFRQNQFGYFLGGPVFIPKLIDGRKTRTYFSTYYEGVRYSRSATTSANVPTEAQRNGDFSSLLGGQIGTDCLGRPVYKGAIYDITTNRANANCPNGYVRDPFPNNKVPRIHPVAQAYMTAYYPLPNQATSPNLVLGQRSTRTADQYGVRMDHSLSDTKTLYGRFSNYDWVNETPSGIPNQRFNNQNHGTNITAHYSDTFSSTFIMDIMAAYNRSGIPMFYPGIGGDVGAAFDKAVGPDFYDTYTASGNMPNGQGLSGSIFTSPFSGYSYELANPDFTYQLNADFKKVSGRHQLSFGFRYTYAVHVSGEQGAASQTYQPATTGLPGFAQTGESLASFMVGYQWRSYSAIWPHFKHWSPIYNGYFGDSWKVTPKLTLNLGLQYVYAAPPLVMQGGVKDAISLLDWSRAVTQPDATDFTYAYLWCTTNPINGLPPNCERPSIVSPDRKNFAPRIGIAYLARKNTVIRAGFGMFYDFNNNINQDSIRMSAAVWPYGKSVSWDGQNTDYLGPLDPILSLDHPWPAVTTKPPPGSNQAISKDFKTPYSMQWNLGFEQFLPYDIKLGVDYVGTGAARMTLARYQNMARLGSGSPASRRPVHNLAVFSYQNSDSNSNYHSLQIKGERSFSTGLTFMNSFTWSKALGVAGAYGSLQAPALDWDRRLSYGPLDYDIPFMNVLSFVYDLPFGRGRKYGSNWSGVADQILGGWETSGIVTIRSGLNYSVAAGQDVANLGFNTGQLAQIVSDPVPSGFTQTRLAWFDKAAFALPAYGTLGNSSPGFLIGPAYQNVDFVLMKNFRIHEELKFQFRSEFFNMFNHTNFGNPNGTFTSPNFGQIWSAYGAREIQFGLKILW